MKVRIFGAGKGFGINGSVKGKFGQNDSHLPEKLQKFVAFYS